MFYDSSGANVERRLLAKATAEISHTQVGNAPISDVADTGANDRFGSHSRESWTARNGRKRNGRFPSLWLTCDSEGLSGETTVLLSRRVMGHDRLNETSIAAPSPLLSRPPNASPPPKNKRRATRSRGVRSAFRPTRTATQTQSLSSTSPSTASASSSSASSVSPTVSAIRSSWSYVALYSCVSPPSSSIVIT